MPKEQLLNVKQGRQEVAEYTPEFCTLAAGNGWNKPALKPAFSNGLDAEVITELACRDE